MRFDLSKPMFDGELAFLSNFYEKEYGGTLLKFYNLEFKTAEAAYQATKVFPNRDLMAEFCNLTPGQSKRLGRKVKLRSDWEDIKVDMMEMIVERKFRENPELAKRLIATGDLYIIETNNWKDKFWGVSLEDFEGKNMLGKILMDLRNQLVKEQVDAESNPEKRDLILSLEKILEASEKTVKSSKEVSRVMEDWVSRKNNNIK